MPLIRFTTHANHLGQHYRPGQTAKVDDATAAAYVEVQQARIVTDDSAESPAGKKTVRRAGRPAETAERLPGEPR